MSSWVILVWIFVVDIPQFVSLLTYRVASSLRMTLTCNICSHRMHCISAAISAPFGTFDFFLFCYSSSMTKNSSRYQTVTAAHISAQVNLTIQGVETIRRRHMLLFQLSNLDIIYYIHRAISMRDYQHIPFF